jgi:DNA-binding response OmpR family regulator
MHSFATLEHIIVVIAEHDDDIRSSLAAFLNQKGATVFACPNAGEA